MSGADSLSQELRAAFSLTAVAGVLVAPTSHSSLLEMIVKTATRVIGARAGSLLLIDEATHELVFEVAATEDVTQLKSVRVPLGQGIAGLVAMTGQPLAVADAQNDPRHASEIAGQTGYLPRSLLCVPLQYEDEIIGVLELLDKEGTPTFDANDMYTLGLFARQAAVAIEQSRAHRNLAALLRELLGSSAATAGDLAQRVSSFAATLETDATFRRSVELAALIHEIAQQGEDESQACLAILRGFADYTRALRRKSPQLSGSL
jgi:GAF domain-containing protein